MLVSIPIPPMCPNCGGPTDYSLEAVVFFPDVGNLPKVVQVRHRCAPNRPLGNVLAQVVLYDTEG